MSLLLLYNIIIEGKGKTIWLESSYIPLQSGQTRFRGQQQQQPEPPRYVRRRWYNIIVIHLHCTITDINILYFIQSAMRVCAPCIPIIVYILSRRDRNYFFLPFRTSETIRLQTLVRRNPIVGTSCARGLGACVGILLHAPSLLIHNYV